MPPDGDHWDSQEVARISDKDFSIELDGKQLISIAAGSRSRGALEERYLRYQPRLTRFLG
jgi:hypothetical protein